MNFQQEGVTLGFQEGVTLGFQEGVTLGSQVGFLDFTPEAADSLLCKDPITDHFEVEMTPFARGKFAAVRRVRCLRTGAYCAAKVVRRRRRARDIRYETIHEAAVLALARENPKIVKLHQVFEGPSEMTLVLELASGGELQRVIDEEERIEERVVRRYLTHILTALRFLHSHQIAHLDLKPQNILLTGPYPDSDVKLCDFGISRVILSDIEVREILGTPDYVAPEILQYEPISLATDMWSVGVLAYVLLTGHSPFGGDSKQETFLNISQCQLDFPDDLFSGISSLAIEFISKLLIVEPSSRLTVNEALTHPWLCSSSDISLPQPRLPIVQMREEHDITLVLSLKRSSSESKTVVSNKENNRNLLNSPQSPSGTGGSSPPSKRECRESTEGGEPDGDVHTNGDIVSRLPPQSPRLSKPHNSPKSQPRTPTKDRGRVSKQIKNIEMRLRSTPPNAENCDNPEGTRATTTALLKSRFTNQVNLKISNMPTVRRNNLNKSFGSVDQQLTKEKTKPNLRLSPLGLRRNHNQSQSTSHDQKFGTRTDFQDIVIRNGYIC